MSKNIEMTDGEKQKIIEQSEFYKELLKEFVEVYGEDALKKVQDKGDQ